MTSGNTSKLLRILLLQNSLFLHKLTKCAYDRYNLASVFVEFSPHIRKNTEWESGMVPG